jgi:hypothetical protein
MAWHGAVAEDTTAPGFGMDLAEKWLPQNNLGDSAGPV